MFWVQKGVPLRPTEIATRAGLRYLPDDRPGITRRRRGRGFSYAGRRGGAVSATDRERISDLVIPPAWESVWIAPEPDAHLQATGIDAAGRKQYLYHAAWREHADEAKFERFAGFATVLERLRRQVDSDLRSRKGDLPPAQLLSATVVRLIDRCLVRPGNRRRARLTDAVGATEFGSNDVEVRNGVVLLDFVGKSGVGQHIEVLDRQLARVLSGLLDANDGLGDTLFASVEGDRVDERRLNEYIATVTNRDFTAKDFRTWGATSTVVGELGPVVVGDGEDGAVFERAAMVVAAEALGNTPAVCRSSYVAPVVLDAFRSGGLHDYWRATRRGQWLSRAERATAKIFDDGA